MIQVRHGEAGPVRRQRGGGDRHRLRGDDVRRGGSPIAHRDRVAVFCPDDRRSIRGDCENGVEFINVRLQRGRIRARGRPFV